MSPRVGEEFGGFRIDEVIGRGGMGVVFRAWQLRMRRAVALKVLPPEFAADPVYRERFGREAAALARLDSPHVVTIFDHGEIDGCLYLAMQLVDGSDLSRVLGAGPLPAARALAVVDQVASALGDAHEVGVVHRDVKTSNVLLRRRAAHHDEDFAYLCDFGIARSTNATQTSDTGGLIGTLGYMSPERLEGAPATAASDIYALGCLLWVSLTGAVPYGGTEPEVIMAHIRQPVPQLVVDDPRTADLNALLAATMAKDPAARPSVRELREWIRALRANIPVNIAVQAKAPKASVFGARAVSAGTPGVRRSGGVAPPRRRRRWPIVAGAVAVVVAAGAVLAFVLWPTESPGERITRSTPTGVTCTPVAPSSDQVRAQVVCRTGSDVGDLRIAALADTGAANAYLREAAGIDPAGLTEGKCPQDLPTRQSWSRDGHGGTLVCSVVGTTTRYAWTDDQEATVSVLDGRPNTPFPGDLKAVDDFFTAARFGA